MENEEKYIKERLGQDNPFRVPDGYFNSLTDRVMNQLPERQQKSRSVHLRAWLYTAACVAVLAVMGVSFLFHHIESEQQKLTVTTETTNTDNTYIDDVVDYAMIDNAEIYACLADN